MTTEPACLRARKKKKKKTAIFELVYDTLKHEITFASIFTPQK